ncbi:MAG TPA: acetate--CoA ligase family protein, partial [Streptosporangiaceae bacterium]
SLELAAADPGVDAVLALTATTAAGDLVPEVSAARLPVPIAAAVMDQVEAIRLLPGPGEDGPAVPAYAYPESAARALGHAARYGIWRAAPPGRIPELDGLHPDRAKELVAGLLADAPTGGWLPLAATAELLGCYGVPLAAGITVTTEDTAIAAAERFAGPVALKADVPGLARSSAAYTVAPGLHGADDIRRGFRTLRENLGQQLTAVIIQPMITGGTEVTISMLHEQVLGPLVLLGPGAAAAGTLADRAARITPLTDSDAEHLIRSVPGRGAPSADLAALKDMLLRVSRIADDLPQIAELHLIPVIAWPAGAQVLDARVRIQAAEPADAYLRRLP